MNNVTPSCDLDAEGVLRVLFDVVLDMKTILGSVDDWIHEDASNEVFVNALTISLRCCIDEFELFDWALL